MGCDILNNKELRLAGITYESLVNGPGIRRVFFAQGCKHNCKGCHNPETHDSNGGKIFNIDDLVRGVKDDFIIKGVTFSGGDPFEQAEGFYYLAEELKKLKINIWCYTGYTFEYILKNKINRACWNKLLNSIDILVDGKFEEEKMDETLKFRGSSNQRIIDVKESIKLGRVITLDY